MNADSTPSQEAAPILEVMFDGKSVEIPDGCRSIVAIRCYLERLAMEQQRFLWTLEVEGPLLEAASTSGGISRSLRVTAKTTSLNELPSQIILTARFQVAAASSSVESLVGQVLINNIGQARELWWRAAQDLKAPLLTLSTFTATTGHPRHGGASAMRLRRWQLEQLATIMKEVDQVARSKGTMELATVLEQRVLVWLSGLGQLLDLLHATLLAEERLAGSA